MWDVEKKEVLSKTDVDAVPSALAWHPGSSTNTLASIGEDGRIHLWNSVIPAHMLTPSAPLDDRLPRPATSQDQSPGNNGYQSRLEVKMPSPRWQPEKFTLRFLEAEAMTWSSARNMSCRA